MIDLYEKRDKAFNTVSAFVIMSESGQEGVIQIKYPSYVDGRLTVFLHLFGDVIQSASVSGMGYDKVAKCLSLIANKYPTSNLHLRRLFVEALKENANDFDHYRTYGKYKLYKAV